MSEVFVNPFDWNLLYVFIAFAIPGLALGIGGFTRVYWPYIRVHYPEFKKFNVVAGYTFGNLLAGITAIVIGIYLAPTVNSRFVYFMALLNQKNIFQAFTFEFIPAIMISIPASLAYLFYYYYSIRPSTDEETLVKYEKMRNHAGLGVRIFFYGFFGEIVFRWGIQSILIWLLMDLTGYKGLIVIPAILLTATFQGYIHIYGFQLIKRKMDRSIIKKTFGINFFSSLVYGVIFWKFGIFSAMVAHAVLHLIWYPLDIFYYRKLPID